MYLSVIYKYIKYTVHHNSLLNTYY